MLALDMAQRVRILRLLASSELGRLFMRTADEDGDDDPHFFRRRNRRARPDPNRFPKVPSETGARLMNFGNFGANEIRSLKNITQKKKLARRILDRELGIDTGAKKILNQQLMAQVVQSLSPGHCIADSLRA
jgi:DDB1- and CUL4-associated factor 11